MTHRVYAVIPPAFTPVERRSIHIADDTNLLRDDRQDFQQKRPVLVVSTKPACTTNKLNLIITEAWQQGALSHDVQRVK